MSCHIDAYFGSFGECHLAGTGATRLSPPRGEPCHLCNEPITETEHGVWVWVQESKYELPVLAPQHRECGLRALTGGIGHLVDCAFWCTQIGDGDAGLGYRASSLAVWEHINSGTRTKG